MFNRKVIIFAIIFILLIGIYLTLRLNPPLQSNGYSYNRFDPFTVVADIENKGLMGVQLKDVLVNSNSQPEKVELGVSNSNLLITINELQDPSDGISFHDWKEVAVKAQSTMDEKENYALSIQDDEHIENILVKYRYLGIPFTLEIDLSEMKETDHLQEPINFTYNGQTFYIKPFYEEILYYINYLKAKPDANKTEAFEKIIIDSFHEHAQIDFQALGMKLSSSTQLEALEQNTLKLLEHQDDINQIIQEALESSAEYLPITEDTTVFIFPLDPNDYFIRHNMHGVGGVAFPGNKFVLMIDPSANKDYIKYAAAHEYHHIAYLLHNQWDLTNILDYVLLEGKADVFTQVVYNNYQSPWIEPLSVEEETIVLEELKKYWNSDDFSIYSRFLYGGKGMPSWSNYKIGYQIVNSYLENNPDVDVIEWTNLRAEEIIKGSKYSDIIR